MLLSLQNIGEVPSGLLLNNIKQTLSSLLDEILPGIPIIWSSILPRLTWRHSRKTKKMENTRKRINRAMRSYLLKRNCYIITLTLMINFEVCLITMKWIFYS